MNRLPMDTQSMKRTLTLLPLCLLLLLPGLVGQNPAASPQSPQAAATAEWNSMVDEYFNRYFHYHPSEGTAAGFHQYDNQLEDYSQKSRDSELNFLVGA